MEIKWPQLSFRKTLKVHLQSETKINIFIIKHLVYYKISVKAFFF